MTGAEIERIRRQWRIEDGRKRLDAQRDRNTKIQWCLWMAALIITPLLIWLVLALTHEESTLGFVAVAGFPVAIGVIGLMEGPKA